MSKPGAMVKFGRLIGRIGQQGWVRRWEVREQEQAVRQLNEDRDDAMVIELTKRLCGASKSWDDEQYCMSMCYLDSVNEPLDSLLRYLEKVDDPKNCHQHVPIIYQLHHPTRSPLDICQRNWCEMIQCEGDVMFLLDVFYHDNHCSADF